MSFILNCVIRMFLRITWWHLPWYRTALFRRYDVIFFSCCRCRYCYAPIDSTYFSFSAKYESIIRLFFVEWVDCSSDPSLGSLNWRVYLRKSKSRLWKNLTSMAWIWSESSTFGCIYMVTSSLTLFMLFPVIKKFFARFKWLYFCV